MSLCEKTDMIAKKIVSYTMLGPLACSLTPCGKDIFDHLGPSAGLKSSCYTCLTARSSTVLSGSSVSDWYDQRLGHDHGLKCNGGATVETLGPHKLVPQDPRNMVP